MSEDSIQTIDGQLLAMFESSYNYMKQIDRFSANIINLPLYQKQMYYVITKIHSILSDTVSSIKTKLYAFRLIKETFLLSSHSFYILTLIKILPWIIEIFKEINMIESKNSPKQAKTMSIQFVAKRLSPQVTKITSQTQSTCRSLMQMMEQFLKWNGTNIKQHPFYRIPYQSAFKLYLECFKSIDNKLSISNLTFYKVQDLKNYTNNYLQQQANEQKWMQREQDFLSQLINNYISLPSDQPDKAICLNILQLIVQTADSSMILLIMLIVIELIQSPITGFQTIMLIHELMKVKEIQFIGLVRDELLYSIGYYMLTMSKQNFSKMEHIDLTEILRNIYIWRMQSVAMGMKVQAYDQMFKRMKDEQVVTSESEYKGRWDEQNLGGSSREKLYLPKYKYVLNLVQITNKDKRTFINMDDDEQAVNYIQQLQYQKKINLSDPSSYSSSDVRRKSIQDKKSKKRLSSLISQNNTNTLQNHSSTMHDALIGGGAAAGVGVGIGAYANQKKRKQNQRVEKQRISLPTPAVNQQLKQSLDKSNSKAEGFIKFQNSLQGGDSAAEDVVNNSLQKAQYKQSAQLNRNIYTTKYDPEGSLKIHTAQQHFNSKKKDKQNGQQLHENQRRQLLSKQQYSSSSNSSLKHSYASSKRKEKIEKASSLNKQKSAFSDLYGSGVGINRKKPMHNNNNKNYDQYSIYNMQTQNNDGDGLKLLSKQQDKGQPKLSNLKSFNDSSRSSKSIDQNYPYASNQRADQQKQLEKKRQILRNQQKIPIARTVKKPKFGFNSNDSASDIEDDINDNMQTMASGKGSSAKRNIYTQNSKYLVDGDRNRDSHQTESYHIEASMRSDQDSYSSIPSNFNDVLLEKQINKSDSDVQINGVVYKRYPNKMKELQKEIERTKQQQMFYQKLMKEKQEMAQQIKSKLPEGNYLLYRENEYLKKQLVSDGKFTSSIKTSKYSSQLSKQVSWQLDQGNYLYAPIKFFPKDLIFHVQANNHYEETLRKQIISNRCLLEKSQYFELGYSLKHDENQRKLQKRICLYFKFRIDCDQVDIRLQSNSLLLAEPIQCTLYNILQGKQVKFQVKILGYVLKGRQQDFILPDLKLNIKPEYCAAQRLVDNIKNQQHQRLKYRHQIIIPCSLFNLIEFHSPLKAIQKITTKYSTDIYLCNQQFNGSAEYEYLLNTFKCGEIYRQKRKTLDKNQFHIAYYGYVKRLKKSDERSGFNPTVLFHDLNNYDKTSMNLVIRRLGNTDQKGQKNYGSAFCIQGQNSFKEDKLVLKEILKMLSNVRTHIREDF